MASRQIKVGIPDADRRLMNTFNIGGMRQRIVGRTALPTDVLICIGTTTALDITDKAQIIYSNHYKQYISQSLSPDGCGSKCTNGVAVICGEIVEYELLRKWPRHPTLNSSQRLSLRVEIFTHPRNLRHFMRPEMPFALRSDHAMRIIRTKSSSILSIRDTCDKTWLLLGCSKIRKIFDCNPWWIPLKMGLPSGWLGYLKVVEIKVWNFFSEIKVVMIKMLIFINEENFLMWVDRISGKTTIGRANQLVKWLKSMEISFWWSD